MKRFALLLVLSLVLDGALAYPAGAQIRMEIIGPGSRLSAIALPELKNQSGDDNHEVSAAFIDTLSRDLKLSGYFRIIDPGAYVEDSQNSGFELGQFNMADWSSLNADFLVKGAVSLSGSEVKADVRLFNVAQNRQMMGDRYTGSGDDVLQMARRFADAILKAVTGTRGPFDSRIAFASTRGGRFKEVYTDSLDGGRLYKVTNNPTINIFPSIDRDGGLLLYTSYKSGRPLLYIANLKSRTELPIRSRAGDVIGGALSPDGRSIVAAVERDGITNLHLFGANGREIRALTNDSSISVTPAFSPDGTQLAFTSDRSGNPQIYVTSLSGGAPARITYQGNYNTNPAFSPKGDKIAYQGRVEGRFDIFLIGAKGGQPTRLTSGEGSNESPSWSPDSRYLLFSSTRSGRARLYLMQLETGKIISEVMEDNGDDTSPSWSSWLGE